jgi:hypothetical protein
LKFRRASEVVLHAHVARLSTHSWFVCKVARAPFWWTYINRPLMGSLAFLTGSSNSKSWSVVIGQATGIDAWQSAEWAVLVSTPLRYGACRRRMPLSRHGSSTPHNNGTAGRSRTRSSRESIVHRAPCFAPHSVAFSLRCRQDKGANRCSWPGRLPHNSQSSLSQQ